MYVLKNKRFLEPHSKHHGIPMVLKHKTIAVKLRLQVQERGGEAVRQHVAEAASMRRRYNGGWAFIITNVYLVSQKKSLL